MSKHGLNFFINGVTVSVDEMGEWVTQIINFSSERNMELFSHDATHAILDGIKEKIDMAEKENQSRAGWVQRHPPNHAGFYYCHLCGGYVHISQAELDEIEPRSYRRGEDPLRDDNRRMAHAWPVYGPGGNEFCPGNRGKGSRQLPSKTMEIAPPDGAV